MAPYQEKFPVGTVVRISDLSRLEEFQRTWRFHHKLQEIQLEFAGQIAEVANVSYYHGGDVIYQLQNIPGIWHEQCLEAS